VSPLAPEEQERRRAAMSKITTRALFIASLGITVERWTEDGVRLRLPFQPQLTNEGSVYHGGAVASLVDTAGAAAVWAGHDFDRGSRAATVSLTVNYTGAASEADLFADAVCVKRGRDLSFSEIRVTDPGGKLVATGTLVYRIVP
jgi:uncharacterized protein (TIGR00369 family)